MTKITLGEFREDNVWIAHEAGRILGYCQHDNAGRFGPSGVTLDTGWTYAAVTGIASHEKVGEQVRRVLRVRRQSDIVPL